MPGGRREVKFLLAQAEYAVIKNRVAALLEPDEHSDSDGGYFIRSIYFDDIRDTAYREKVNGVFDRRKFRIRLYNDDLTFIRLESKEKYNKWIIKQHARIDENIAKRLLDEDFRVLDDSENDFLKHFSSLTSEIGLRSVVTTDYYREAYMYPASNLRITFDKHLHASGLTGFSLVRGEAGDWLSLPIFRHDEVVMEIKYDDFMPEMVSAVIPRKTGKALAVSKYCLCRAQAIGLSGI
ncbi:MAG: polyphosphate polymerase domain-containing protein [Lachnospiraceae bacterium]|jgi:hypothetical protein|nr:polyphosphate polymerase domain-containing protein [Lachnospiraceae bacterium]